MRQRVRVFLTLLCVILSAEIAVCQKGLQNRLRSEVASNRHGHHGEGTDAEIVLDG